MVLAHLISLQGYILSQVCRYRRNVRVIVFMIVKMSRERLVQVMLKCKMQNHTFAKRLLTSVQQNDTSDRSLCGFHLCIRLPVFHYLGSSYVWLCIAS